MEEIIDHEKVRNEILKVLYKNRGQKPLKAHNIRKEMDEDYGLRPKEIEAYLRELIDEKMVKKEAGKTHKIPSYGNGTKTETIKSLDTYYLTTSGISYVESNFISKPQTDMSRIADGINRIGDLTSLLVDQSKLSNEEQIRQNELLEELRKALHDDKDKDDNKARKILKTALDAGKSIAIPLLVEYLKSELKSKGIFL